MRILLSVSKKKYVLIPNNISTTQIIITNSSQGYHESNDEYIMSTTLFSSTPSILLPTVSPKSSRQSTVRHSFAISTYLYQLSSLNFVISLTRLSLLGLLQQECGGSITYATTFRNILVNFVFRKIISRSHF